MAVHDILVVDDSRTELMYLRDLLARHGFSVRTAESADEAYRQMGEALPDLILLDVVMPGMDGPAMARAIRRLHPDLPFLFMSGYAEEQLRKSIDLEKVAFLPKPFSMQELAEAVRTVLSKAQTK